MKEVVLYVVEHAVYKDMETFELADTINYCDYFLTLEDAQKEMNRIRNDHKSFIDESCCYLLEEMVYEVEEEYSGNIESIKEYGKVKYSGTLEELNTGTVTDSTLINLGISILKGIR